MGDILVEIILTCVDIEKHVRDFYTRVEKTACDPKLKSFWRSLAKEKESHMGYLHKLLVYAKQGVIPQVFSRPFELHEELKILKQKVEDFMDKPFNESSPEEIFFAAYYGEYQVIHEAFATLYQMEIPKLEETPADNITAQVSRFVKIVNNATENKPLFLLLGDALNRLWSYTKLFTQGNLIDNLTGVLSRQGFFNKVVPWLEMMAREKKMLAVFIVDIDHLKKINEESDSKTGDRILRFVAKELKNLCRKSDIIGRFGGDEFILFLPSVEKQNLENIAERFRKRVEEKSKTSELFAEGVTISVGGVYGKIQSRNIMPEFQKFIDSADTLLLRKVKRTGGNGYALFRME